MPHEPDYKPLTTVTALLVVIFAPILAFGVTNESDLVQFWKTNAPVASVTPSNYLSMLKKLGVEEANSLSVYLDSKEFQEQALYSMLLLTTESNRLESATIGKVISLSRTMPRESSIQMTASVQVAAIRLLVEHLEDAESQYSLRHAGLAFSTEATDKILAWLGEVTARQPEKRALAKPIVKDILSIRTVYANRGMAAVGKDSVKSLISSIGNWPLYEEPDMAELFAQLILKRIKGPYHRVPAAEFSLAVEFLLSQSKADPDFLAKRLCEIACNEDVNLSSAILWLLVQAKNTSTVARKTLDTFNRACEQNRNILQSIEAGKLNREDAFDKPLERLHQKVPVRSAESKN